jgi:hypothetical protein
MPHALHECLKVNNASTNKTPTTRTTKIHRNLSSSQIPMAKKRSTRWWWNHFAEHPGYANKEDTSMVSGKAKVIYEQHIAREQQLDQEQVSTGQRESPRDMSAIVGTRTSGILLFEPTSY